MSPDPAAPTPPAAPQPRLLDCLRAACRLRHYSPRWLAQWRNGNE
jgi:hypothetical protein